MYMKPILLFTIVLFSLSLQAQSFSETIKTSNAASNKRVVSFDPKVDTFLNNDKASIGFNNNATISAFSITGNVAGTVVSPVVQVMNSGTSPVASFDVTIDYNGAQYTRSLTFIDLQPDDSMDIGLANAFPLVPGSLTATATVANVNGTVDDDPSDNQAMLTIDPIVPAAGKVVVAETIVGTWAGYCPRGYVFMDEFEQELGPYGVVIDVHISDIMAVQSYADDIYNLITVFPGTVVDRDVATDPSLVRNDLIARLQTPPTAFLSTHSWWDEGARELRVIITADFQAAANDEYKLAVVLSEDGVTGTSFNYDQTNDYSGGGFGPMGGYESLPNPVPASDMVYNRVARAIEPSFGGDAASFPAVVNAGDTYSRTYNFNIPESWDEGRITVIGLMMNPAGSIDNASKSGLGENDTLFESGFEGL